MDNPSHLPGQPLPSPTPPHPDPPLDYLIRFAQIHPSFRKPEIEALAKLAGVGVEFVSYSDESPYSIVRLSPLPTTTTTTTTTSPTPSSSTLTFDPTVAATALISRSITSKAIYALWAQAPTYSLLHARLKTHTRHLWPRYATSSFKFEFDTFARAGPSLVEQREIVDGFAYMGFMGEIRMRGAEEKFVVFEEYDGVDRGGEGEGEGQGEVSSAGKLKRVYLGRFIASSARAAGILDKYTLKKRAYINTTSMDAELAFLMANMTLAAEGKLFYDPFVGTGGLLVSCAHFGARCWGSDIDGRMVRGVGGEGRNGGKKMTRRDVRSNFGQYGIEGGWMDGFVADLTHCPLRSGSGRGRWLDGIVCDPPYGVREGLKVLGHREGKDRAGEELALVDGAPAHLQDAYVPPKKPYSLEAMLGDILEFSARMLVDDGRVGLWMPTANDAEEELAIPEHRGLELVSMCVQEFNKWSRRLLTYRRIPGVEVEEEDDERESMGKSMIGTTADELNGFRKKYFQGFRNVEKKPMAGGDPALSADGEQDQVRSSG